jgi:hypothetical protein
MGGPLPLIPSPSPVGVQGVTCITDGADTFMYWDHDTLLVTAWWLVDGYVLIVSPRGCMLAGVELMSPGH